MTTTTDNRHDLEATRAAEMLPLSLGCIHATPGALAAHPIPDGTRPGTTPRPFIFACLDRHRAGDWGDTGRDKDEPWERSDWELNNAAVIDGSRVFSVFYDHEDGKIWIITDATDDAGNRHCTTIMLPEEY